MTWAGLVLAGLCGATPALGSPPAPPKLTVPGSVTAEPESRAGVAVAFAATALDWKERTVPVACAPASGSLFPLGTTTVSCVATDRRGERATDSFQMTVEHLFRPVEGARLKASRRLLFDWFPVEKVRLYNLQLWRRSASGWKKVASVFPSGHRFPLGRTWLYHGHRYRLRGGSYAWFVWPWLGSRYGSILGGNSFSVQKT